jgi:ABC-type phosphate transport system ATPase subunit
VFLCVRLDNAQAPAMVAVLGPSGGGKTTFIRFGTQHTTHKEERHMGGVW